MFTAGDVYRKAVLLAPELQAKPPARPTVAALFDEILTELVGDVMDMDEERLAGSATVPAAVVDVDPVDLTDDGTGTGAREWLRIIYIEWVDEDETDGEVYLATLEARHRAQQEYAPNVVGYLEDQQRKVRKVSGWDSVDTLKVYGVLEPTSADRQDLEAVSYDYPRSMELTLRWELLIQMANLRGLTDQRIEYWEAKRKEARDRLLMDAQDHATNRIDDIGL